MINIKYGKIVKYILEYVKIDNYHAFREKTFNITCVYIKVCGCNAEEQNVIYKEFLT